MMLLGNGFETLETEDGERDATIKVGWEHPPDGQMILKGSSDPKDGQCLTENARWGWLMIRSVTH